MNQLNVQICRVVTLHDQDNSAANCFFIQYIFALKINLHTAGWYFTYNCLEFKLILKSQEIIFGF